MPNSQITLRRYPTLSSSQEAFRLFRPHFELTLVEEFWAAALTRGLKVITIQMLFRGTVDSCLVHPRDLFRFACQYNCARLIIAHNHPSGEVQPSQEDLLLTQRLVRASHLFEIPILDHLLIAQNQYLSFLDQGWVCFNTGEILRHAQH